MDREKLQLVQTWVKTQVSPNRFKHILGVARASKRLAFHYRLPIPKALLAAWLHDCGKELPKSRMKTWLKLSPFKLDPMEEELLGLWHPHVGAAIAFKKWGIKDPAILEAIRRHTLGSPGMSPLAQLIFVADFIEEGRKFRGVSMARKMAGKSLSKTVSMKASMTITVLFEKKSIIHPRLLETWNYYLKDGGK